MKLKYFIQRKISLNKLLALPVNIFYFQSAVYEIKETRTQICAVCTLSLAAEYFS